jgi:hypothetical protein
MNSFDLVKTAINELIPSAVISRGLSSDMFGFQGNHTFFDVRLENKNIQFILKHGMVIIPLKHNEEFDIRNPSSIGKLNEFLIKTLKEN